MWKAGFKSRMGLPFKKKTARKWRISVNRNASKWNNGQTLGLIGGGVGLLAGTTYYFIKRKGQPPRRSHISIP